MKINFSNLLAIFSILVWATAWFATVRHTTANAKSASFEIMSSSRGLLSVDAGSNYLMLSR